MPGNDGPAASAMTMMIESEESNLPGSALRQEILSAGSAFSGTVERILKTKEKTVYIVKSAGGAVITCSFKQGCGSAPLRGDKVRGSITRKGSDGIAVGVIEEAAFISI